MFAARSARSPAGSRRPQSAAQPAPHLLFQSRGRRVAATRQRPDHHPVRFVKVPQHGAGDVTQPARDPMAFDGRPDRLGDDQTHPRSATFVLGPARPDVHDQVGLNSLDATLHRRLKVRRPPHPVACGKHRQNPALRSGSQRATTLAAPVRHDGTPGPGAHPQAETVHAGSPAIVRLEGPLALGHDVLLVVSRSSRSTHPLARRPVGLRVDRGVVLCSLAGAVPIHGSQPYRRRSGDCLRVLTRLGWVKPGLRQRTRTMTARIRFASPVGAARSRPGPKDPRQLCWNGTELLAAARKTVSFCQGQFRLERRSTTKRGWRID